MSTTEIELRDIRNDIELRVMKGQGQGGGVGPVEQEDYDALLVPKNITGSRLFGNQLQLISEHCQKEDSKFTKDDFNRVLTAELFQNLYEIDELEQARSELEKAPSILGNDPNTSLTTRYDIYRFVRDDIKKTLTSALGMQAEIKFQNCKSYAIDAFLNRFDTYLSIHILCMPFIIEIIKLYKYLYSKTYIQIEENQFAYLTECLNFVSVSGKQAINKLYLGAFNILHKLLNISNAAKKEELVKDNMFQHDYQAIHYDVLNFRDLDTYHQFPILSEYDMFQPMKNMLTKKINRAYNSTNFRERAKPLVVTCETDNRINGTYVVSENQSDSYPIFMCEEKSTTIECIDESGYAFKRENEPLYTSNIINIDIDIIDPKFTRFSWYNYNERYRNIGIIIQYKEEAEEEERQRKAIEAAEEAEKQRKAAETLRKAKEAEEAEKKRKAAEEEAEKKRKAEETEKKRKAAEEEAEKQIKEAEEAETLRKAAEEAEKQRKAAEEAERQRKAAKDDRKRRKQIDEILLNDICEAPNYDPTIGTVLTEEFFNSLGDCEELQDLNYELSELEKIDERIFYGDISVDATKNLSLKLEKKEQVVDIFNGKIKRKMGKIGQNEQFNTCIERALIEFNSRFEPYLNIHIVWMPFFKQIIQLNRCLYSRTYDLMMPNNKEVPTTAFNLLKAYLVNMSDNEILNYYRVIRNIIEKGGETAIMFDTDREKIAEWLKLIKDENAMVFTDPNMFKLGINPENLEELKAHLNWRIGRVINAKERRKNAKKLLVFHYNTPQEILCKLTPSQNHFKGVEIYMSDVDNISHTFFELVLINGYWILKKIKTENDRATNIIKYGTSDIHTIPEFSMDSEWYDTNNTVSSLKIISEELYNRHIEFKKRKAAEDAERQRKAAEDAERQRKAAEDAERQRKAAEDAERQRKATEDAERQRKATEDAERQRKAAEDAAEAERLRVVEVAEEKRLAKEAVERKKKEDEDAERQRKAKEADERQRKTVEEADRQKLHEFKVYHKADTLLDIPDEFITFKTENYNKPLTKCVTAYINLCHDRNSKFLMKYVNYFIQLSSSFHFNNIITKTYTPRGNITGKQVFKKDVLPSITSAKTDPKKLAIENHAYLRSASSFKGQIADVFAESADYNPFQDFIYKTLYSSSDHNKPFKLIQVLILFIRNISFYIMSEKDQPVLNKNPESDKDLLQLIEHKYRRFKETAIIPHNIMTIICNVYKFALKCYYKFSDFEKPSIMLDNIIMIIHALVFILLLHFHVENTNLLSGGKSTMKHKGKSTIKHGGKSIMKHGGKSTMKHGGKSTMKHGGKSTMKHGGKSTMKHGGKSTMKHKETRRKYIKGGNIKDTIKIILKNINMTEITNLLVELTVTLKNLFELHTKSMGTVSMFQKKEKQTDRVVIDFMKINPTIDHHLIHEHVVTHA